MSSPQRRQITVRPSPALAELRASIDNLDAALIHLLAERFRCTRRVGEWKAAAGMPPADPEREAFQIHRLRRLALDAGLDPEFAEKVLALIIGEVIRHHEVAAEAATGAADAG